LTPAAFGAIFWGAMKRLVLCFDGTWNTPEDETSVSRMYAEIADVHGGCRDQLKFYDAGVGTTVGSKLAGGLFGRGLDRNILEGYAWLVNQFIRDPGPPIAEPDGQVFDPGPQIFLFGFSRGAYTARSLAGMLNRCGLVRRELIGAEPATPDTTLLQDAWTLYREKNPGPGEARLRDPWLKFRTAHSLSVKVAFLGVWDTVGALGIPMARNAPIPISRGYEFHDVTLGRIVEQAFHAVAIDEQREDFQVALWDGAHAGAETKVEQRWFAGAHANVGGGYQDDMLPDPPLKWMAERAIEAGLEFNNEFTARLPEAGCKASLPANFELRGDEYLGPVRDSYDEFAFGLYKAFRFVKGAGRYQREMLVKGLNETIDATAHKKWVADTGYRPANFAAAGRLEQQVAGGRP
jgi:uncharacterized protein (DUF2235 family)